MNSYSKYRHQPAVAYNQINMQTFLSLHSCNLKTQHATQSYKLNHLSEQVTDVHKNWYQTLGKYLLQRNNFVLHWCCCCVVLLLLLFFLFITIIDIFMSLCRTLQSKVFQNSCIGLGIAVQKLDVYSLSQVF